MAIIKKTVTLKTEELTGKTGRVNQEKIVKITFFGIPVFFQEIKHN